MDQQLTAFVDLLGFSSIQDDDERESQILSLLTSLAGAKSESSLQKNYIDAINCERTVTPAISAFSDHIVFSFTLDQLGHVGAGVIAFNLANNIAWIFSRAIRLGCLVRGGIAFGPLHHAGGVVFGRGLVKAYELESKFAKWPRIIVSSSAAEKLGSHLDLHSDDDGFLWPRLCAGGLRVGNKSRCPADSRRSCLGLTQLDR